MDVDATHTREEFLRRMRGKCFGCGSSAHTKKDGSHDRDLCAYCKHVGHREVACMDKFLGRPKGQKAAATGEGNEVEVEVEVGTPEEEPKWEEGIAATQARSLAQLMEQQKALAKQIAALREQDF
jgi:hypothetical protein